MVVVLPHHVTCNRSLRPLQIEPPQGSVVFTAKLPTVASQKQLLKNKNSLYCPSTIEADPRHNQACMAFASRTVPQITDKNTRQLKLPVFTCNNGWAPLTGPLSSAADFNPTERWQAELLRLATMRSYVFAGAVWNEIPGAKLRGTKPGALGMGPCQTAGSATVMAINVTRNPFVPGDLVRWTMPYLENKPAKPWTHQSPPVVYQACPKLSFNELEKVEYGTLAEGCAVIAYPMSLIHWQNSASGAGKDQRLAAIPEVQALARLACDHDQGRFYRQLIKQCRDIAMWGDCRFPFNTTTPVLHQVGGQPYEVRLDPNEDIIPIARKEGDEKRIGLVYTNADGGLEQVEAYISELFYWYHYHFAGDSVQGYVCDGDLALVSETDTGEGKDIRQVIPNVFESSPPTKLYGWAHRTTSGNHRGALGIELEDTLNVIAFQLAEYILEKINDLKSTARVRFATVLPNGRKLIPMDWATPIGLSNWLAGQVSNVDTLRMEPDSRIIGKVNADNNAGSIVVTLRV